MQREISRQKKGYKIPPGGGTLFDNQSLHESSLSTRKHLRLGMDFNITRLDNTNVPQQKRNAMKEGKELGETSFQSLMALLKKNFPQSEIENPAQYRDYFFDENSAKWFVDVAVTKEGTVMGANMYSYFEPLNSLIYNIVVIDKECRSKGIASDLLKKMFESGNKIANEKTGSPLYAVVAEIEQPNPNLPEKTAKQKLAKYIRNVVRPWFHDFTTQFSAILDTKGIPLTYMLPVMASKEEIQAAIEKGKPIEPEELLFCIRFLTKDKKEGISSRETARFLIAFYKEYLEAECSDVSPGQVNEFLAKTLAKLTDGLSAGAINELLVNKADYSEIYNLIPERTLAFSSIRGTAIKKD